MNADTPPPNAEEGSTSAPLEKLPKLNLPPKPVLSSTTITEIPSVTLSAAAPAAPAPVTRVPEAPTIVTPSTKTPPPPPVINSTKKTEMTDAPASNKKRATLSLPLALFAFVVALLGLIVQIFSFLHLF